ncbi:hypothetical protein [Psychroserpens damuponensis]|uniref:hypothetical protein n=1 Tax=Psychroserpens damuponensis TaxID=943936 RepID=UPI00058BA2BC|nr:hypothetical protein [Psychroserpens damuponensis]
MKKIFILSVACFLFAGSQMAFAQTKANSPVVTSNTTIQNSAKEKTNEVVNMLLRTDKLDETQQKKIYEIFSSVEKKMKGVESIKDSSARSAKKAKLQKYVNEKLKNVLTDSQYQLYLKNMPK